MKTTASLLVLLLVSLLCPVSAEARKRIVISRPSSKPPVYKKHKAPKRPKQQVHWGRPRR